MVFGSSQLAAGKRQCCETDITEFNYLCPNCFNYCQENPEFHDDTGGQVLEPLTNIKIKELFALIIHGAIQ